MCFPRFVSCRHFSMGTGGGGTGTYTSSTTLSKTIDPVWNEEFVLSVKDPANSQLECSLWDWSGADDTTQQKFLGEVILNLAKLVPHNNTFINQVFEIKQGKQHTLQEGRRQIVTRPETFHSRTGME